MTTQSQRSPFEVMLTVAFGLYCVAGLAAFEKVATTTLRAYPEPWGRAFLALGLVTCIVTLAGIARANTAYGVLIERAGLFGLAGACGAYAVWGISNGGLRSLAFCLLLGALSAAAGWRVWQISGALGAARRV